jgi:hypothetical protein
MTDPNLQYQTYPVLTTSLKPRKWPTYIPLFVSAFVLMMGYKTGKLQEMQWIALALIGVWAILSFLFNKLEIIIDDYSLRYKTIFREKVVKWTDVTATYLKYQHEGKSGSYYWFFEQTAAKTVKFSISFYSRKSLQILSESVVTKCSNARIEDRIRNMAAGKFPWFVF